MENNRMNKEMVEFLNVIIDQLMNGLELPPFPAEVEIDFLNFWKSLAACLSILL